MVIQMGQVLGIEDDLCAARISRGIFSCMYAGYQKLTWNIHKGMNFFCCPAAIKMVNLIQVELQKFYGIHRSAL